MADSKSSVDYITLQFDDETTCRCMIEGIFDVDGQDYISLVPTNHSGDVYIYKYIEKDEDNYELEKEADAEKFAAAVKAYEKLKGYKPKNNN